MFKRLFSILLILVMVLSFSSCESGLSAQIVNGAIESLDKITTYQYDMNVNVDIVYDTFEVVVSTEFNGVFDVENEQMEMDINSCSIINGDEGQRVGEMYLIDNIVYESVTLIVNDVHDMEPMWTKREMPAGYWEEMNQVKVQIAFLEEVVQVEVIGSDEVRGIDCYVLEIIPDMEKFWQTSMQQPGVAMLPAIDEEFPQEVFKGFSMKQWIEKDTYFLAKAEIETVLELTPEALGSPEEQGLITMDITIDLMVYNYNQPVSIILPQEAEEAPEMPKYTTTTIIVTESATPINPPELVSPHNRATGIDLTPVLLWKEVPNAKGYELNVSRNYDFTDIVHSVSCRLTAYRIVEGLMPSTQYYWIVAAKLNPGDPHTPIAWSPVWTFTTGTAAAERKD